MPQYSRVLALLGLAAIACAFENIAIQDTVQAGVDIQGTIANDLGKGAKSFDAGFTNYRIYLATTPPGRGTGPSCVLVNGSTIDKTTFTVNIPKDVGPDGEFYSLATIEYNSDETKDGPSGFQYSNSIDLKGATGNWSQSELDGKNFVDADNVMCSGYGCARGCASKFYSKDKEEDEAALTATQKCINACPGVVPVDTEASDTSNSTDSASSTESQPSATTTGSRNPSNPSASTTANGSQGAASTGSTASATATGAASVLKASFNSMTSIIGLFLFFTAMMLP